MRFYFNSVEEHKKIINSRISQKNFWCGICLNTCELLVGDIIWCQCENNCDQSNIKNRINNVLICDICKNEIPKEFVEKGQW